MIDIHSHILYGIDDGSKSLENSILMAKEAVNNGVTQICCTPHYLEPEYSSKYEENLKLIEELKKSLKKENIKLELNLGNEIFVTENTIEDIKSGKVAKINESKYVLIEFPMVTELRCSDKIVNNLLNSGLKVIIAHPERYKYIQSDPEYMVPFLKKGVIFQGNLGSVMGMYGESARKSINELIKRNMIQVLASDAHKTNSIYFKLNKTLEKYKEKISEDYLNELIEINPQKILNNEDVEIREFKKKKKFIFF